MNIGTALSGADSVDVSMWANAVSRLLQHLVRAPASDGIWYARGEFVKAASCLQVPKTLAT
jgi:hypothetical protein